jgi:uncharacterized protein YkwD
MHRTPVSRATLVPTLVLMIAALVSVLLPQGGAAAPATAPVVSVVPGAETSLRALVAHERAARALPALRYDAWLTTVARRHAVQMALRTDAYANPLLTRSVSGWKTLGENVARAGSVSDAHRQFMTVVSERTNVLGRGYVKVGIGVASFAGRIYVVEVFDDPLVIGPRLAIGSRGSWVKVVQRKLRLRVTGRYTRSTRTAVMRWQQAHALPVTGVVAYRTWCSFRL